MTELFAAVTALLQYTGPPVWAFVTQNQHLMEAVLQSLSDGTCSIITDLGATC